MIPMINPVKVKAALISPVLRPVKVGMAISTIITISSQFIIV
jgi:hypothetical protein